MLERQTHFPWELMSSFGGEDPGITLENTDENLLFHALFHIEQHIDQLLAYRHIEKNWLPKDIQTLTPAEIITLAQEINGFAAHALTLVKNENGGAGEFLKMGITFALETGIPNVEFDREVVFTLHNYEILRQIHGDKIARDYQLFSILLELESAPLDDQPFIKQLDYWASVIENYKDTAGVQAYQRVRKFVNPKTVAAEMEIFARELVAKIAAKKNPIHCAAFAMSQLSIIHCFAHANRRSARIFMNTLLMMLGSAPILIPQEAVKEYYLAIEKSTAKNVTPLEDLLCLYANKVTLNFNRKMTDEFSHIFLFENQLDIAAKEFEYHCQPMNAASASPFMTALEQGIINSEFYLKKAAALINSAPKVAKFYYERSKRLAQQNAINPDLGGSIAKALPSLMAPRKTPKELKPIYMIAPHETARLSGENAKNADLFLLLQTERLAILLKDQQNNISLTSLDSANSLDFLLREAKTMHGSFTIDVIKHGDDNSDHANTVLTYIQSVFGPVKNSKGNYEARISKRATVLIHDNKILTPEIEDIVSRASFQLFESRYKARPAKASPLKDYELFEGSKPIKFRTIERLVMRALHADRKEQTIVVFDNEWTGDFPQLSAEARKFFAKTAELKPDLQQFANAVKKTFSSQIKNNKDDFQEMIKQIKFYHQRGKGMLYYNLSRFFKAPAATEMPDKAIALITGYAESESLSSFRMRTCA